MTIPPLRASQETKVAPLEQTFGEAIAHHQAGRLIEAERLYHAVIHEAPRHIQALHRLAVLYIQSEKSEQALPLLKDILGEQPKNPEILNSLGVALQNTGHGQEAIAHFRKALALNPTYSGALGNLGKALREQGMNEVALECFLKMNSANSNNPDVNIDIGRCYFEMGQFQKASSYFENALLQRPNCTDALSAMGGALWAMGQHSDARAMFERAATLEPNNAKAVLNLGEFLYDEGKIDDALTCFNRALILSPAYHAALWRKSFALLARGEYREGWKLYAAGLGERDLRGPHRFAPQKLWDGKPDLNKHLLIWCEQGLGDSMQFIRYAELCKRRMGKVTIFCQRPLVRLFKALPFIDNASDTCDRGSFDEHVPVMNLPHLFDTVLETIPANLPYLRVDPSTKGRWAAKFYGAPDVLKVGLVWSGGAHEGRARSQIINRQRSLTLDHMKPLLDLADVKFYSLQKEKAAEQIMTLEASHCLTDFMGEVVDFADTAAIIQNLDLVITVDTSVAHLAGGLGKPVWIMSRFNGDWRWLQNRPSNPWYPTARVFGQPKMGDWDSVIEDIRNALISEIAKKNA